MGLLFLVESNPATPQAAPAKDKPSAKPPSTKKPATKGPAAKSPPDQPDAKTPPARPAPPRTLPNPDQADNPLLGDKRRLRFPMPPRRYDEEQLQSQKIRRIEGKRLVLFTDLESSPEVDELPELFALAYPQWCRYFGLEEEDDWRPTGFLMKDQNRFWACGFWDDDFPEFNTGFWQNHEFWVYAQESPYYQRHLMLHEGTHVFMHARIGTQAPVWYIEGMAELLATHRLQGDELQLGYFPRDRAEVVDWGRIRLLKDAYREREARLLTDVLLLAPGAHFDVQSYGWSWGLSAFLNGHPRYRDRFRQFARLIGPQRSDFNEQVIAALDNDWKYAKEEWQVFVGNVEYGYDLERTAIDFVPSQALPDEGAIATVQAAKGWQSTGLVLEAETRYQLSASGQFRLQADERWTSEAQGVSVRYHQGRPLGILQAAVHPDDPDPQALSVFLQPQDVGGETVLLPTTSGTLFLKLNDSPAELADNQGEVMVKITRAAR